MSHSKIVPSPIYSYDAVPYESNAFPQTHPDRLATLGRLFGMSPVPVNRCRVLELGCAAGGNLIPMAWNLPDSSFVGVELSARQVAAGCRMIKDLDLSNIRIIQADIMDIDSKWGEFDYIITHGVYSWVPETVKDKILNVSAVNLAPQGIVYVSYNTYPGWHMREMIRHMMLYHANQFETHQERIEQARALMNFLAGAVSTDNNPYGMLLQKELSLVQNSKDWYLFHEHLEEINSPAYFHQFIERAASHGLQYLGEAEISTMLTSGFSEKVAETLDRISQNIINTEQYMDFLRNRFFRQTLLCHSGVEIKRELCPKDINGMLVASCARHQEEQIDLGDDIKQTFRARDGSVIETPYVLTKAAMIVLEKSWPRALTIEELFSAALYILVNPSEYDTQQAKERLMADIFHCYMANVMELHTWQADFVVEISDHPKISTLARYLFENLGTAVNQRHEVVKMDSVACQLVPLMDGSRDRPVLLKKLEDRVQDGSLEVKEDDVLLTDTERIGRVLDKALIQTLEDLSAGAMLVE